MIFNKKLIILLRHLFCLEYQNLTNMNSKSLLILFLFLIWGSGSTYWYVCRVKGFCEQTQTQAPTTDSNKPNSQKTVKKIKHSLIYFLRDHSEPVINDTLQWQAEVKSLSQLQSEGKKLHIEGPYYAGESNPTDFDNLGLARAEALKKLLSGSIADSLMVTQGKLLEPSAGETPDFIEYDKNWTKWLVDNDFVKEQNQKTIIYFPYNSTKEIRNKAILSYMDGVVSKVKNHPELNILIVGHTDNAGNDASNKLLGLKRANRIKDLLVHKGVDAHRIITKSEGKNQPIADNLTLEGRQKNRRVEISYFKK